MTKNPDDKPSLSVVNLPSSAPKPPANLGPAGVNLWRSIMAEYDISDAGGQALLEQAAAAYDRAERLRVEIDFRRSPGQYIGTAAGSATSKPIERTRPRKKLTHYSACFDNDWRFRRLAFCTPTSCLQ